MLAAGFELQLLAAGPHRELEPTVVVLDAEPDRLVAAFQQVFPPDERALAIGDRTPDHIVDAAVADNRAGSELPRPERRRRGGEREGILAAAARLFGAAQCLDEYDDCGDEKHCGEH